MMRIYKTKAGQNRFIQLFFSEINIAVAVSVFLNLPTFFAEIELNLKIIALLATLTVTVSIAVLKIDGLPLYTLIKDGLLFLFRNKRLTQTELASMSEYYYQIKNDVVFTKTQALAVIQIIPIDVSILNEQEKEDFKRRMRTFLHAIGDHKSIQLKVINRLADPSDYKEHFFDLITQARNNQANKTVTKLIDEYIQNLTHKINQEKVPFKDYFLIVPVWIGLKPKPSILQNYLKELERKVNNLSNILLDNNIKALRLDTEQLYKFYQAQIRYFS